MRCSSQSVHFILRLLEMGKIAVFCLRIHRGLFYRFYQTLVLRCWSSQAWPNMLNSTNNPPNLVQDGTELSLPQVEANLDRNAAGTAIL